MLSAVASTSHVTRGPAATLFPLSTTGRLPAAQLADVHVDAGKSSTEGERGRGGGGMCFHAAGESRRLRQTVDFF